MDLPIELHGDRTGNCVRVSIALEEAELAYVVFRVGLSRGEQLEAKHLHLNPAGKVPIALAHAEFVDWTQTPRLRRWCEKVLRRPAVQRGLHAFDPPP